MEMLWIDTSPPLPPHRGDRCFGAIRGGCSPACAPPRTSSASWASPSGAATTRWLPATATTGISPSGSSTAASSSRGSSTRSLSTSRPSRCEIEHVDPAGGDPRCSRHARSPRRRRPLAAAQLRGDALHLLMLCALAVSRGSRGSSAGRGAGPSSGRRSRRGSPGRGSCGSGRSRGSRTAGSSRWRSPG